MQRVIAYPAGGVGNQLFIYAAAWALAQRSGADLVLNTSRLRRDTFYRRAYALDHFNLGEVTPGDGFSPTEFAYRFYRRLHSTLPFVPHRLGPIIGERSYLGFDPALTDGTLDNLSTVHLFGYRQNERYFADVADAVRRKFEFVFEPSAQAREQADEILGGTAVAVHFRQLHHVKAGETRPNPRIRQLSETYYIDAINTMRKRVPDARFFCFGDSLANIDRLFPAGVEMVVPKPTGDAPADIRDLWLMTKCRHFIIANSSFSWWAAWLGSRPDSLVLCPDTRGFEYEIAPARGWMVI